MTNNTTVNNTYALARRFDPDVFVYTHTHTEAVKETCKQLTKTAGKTSANTRGVQYNMLAPPPVT